MSLPLGILDQSPLVAGGDAELAIDATLALVRLADRLGYRRYWFAEHHGRRYGFGNGAPELLIARMAAETQRIRLGSGGVLLSHYSALKVAESFRLLEVLAPGRIDLGIGRGTGGDDATEIALQGIGTHGQPFPDRVAELLTFLDGGFPSGHPFAGVTAMPAIPRSPAPWILGSTGDGAALAARLGLPFAYAHFIKGDAGEHTARYRADYQPSARFPEPRLIVCIAAYCSDDPLDRADFVGWQSLRRGRLRINIDAAPLTREQSRSYEPTPAERPHVDEIAGLLVTAPRAEIRPRLEAIAAAHGADEIMVVTVAPDYESRTRSYQALAEAWFGTGD